MVQPATTIKAITDAIGTFWSRSSLALACLSIFAWAVLLILYFGRHYHLDRAAEMFSAYGIWLMIAGAVLPIVAGFKWWNERPKPSLVLLPMDEQSFWGQSPPTDGRTTTQFSLKFQATNVSDYTIKLSDVALRRPCVRRKQIITKQLIFQHPEEKKYYSTEYPVGAHSLTYGSAIVIVDRALGTKGEPMRVVVRLQDHTGRWRRLAFPYVRNIGGSPRA